MRSIARQLNGPIDLEAVIATAKTIPFKSEKGKELKWWVTFTLEQPKRTPEQLARMHTIIRLFDKEINGGDDFDSLKYAMKKKFGPRQVLNIHGLDANGRRTVTPEETFKSMGDYTMEEAELFIQNVRGFAKDWGVYL